MSMAYDSGRKFHYKNGVFTIAEIPAYSQKCGYVLALGIFLDKFYHCNNMDRSSLIMDEPPRGILDDLQHCKLAAATHKLANDYSLPVPAWTMKEDYKMPYPVYAFNSNDLQHQKLLEETTPNEYKIRNLFLGSGVLKRA